MKQLLILLLLCTPLYAQRPPVVRVTSDEVSTKSLGTGTCIASVNNQSLIITANHVIKDGHKFTIRFTNNEIPAQVIAQNNTWDLAILVIKSEFPVAKIGTKVPVVGDSLTVCGFGSGDYREATGTVKEFYSPGHSEPNDIVAMNAKARQGDSGGPIFGSNGTLVAVLFGSDNLGAHGSHCVRVRWFITQIQGYSDLKKEALKNDYILYEPRQ